MASHVDWPLEPRTSPKLPALREGQSSLVCGDKIPSPLSARDLALDWAADIRRRINHLLNEGKDVSEDDVRQLKQELVPIFVVCLQQDTRHGWKYLVEVLGLVEPYQNYFEQYDIKAELFHYLERIVWHVKMYKEKLFDLHIVDALQRVFPKEITQLQEGDLRKLKNYCVTVPPIKYSSETPSPRLKKIVPTPPNLLSLPDGSNPYSMYISTEEQIHKVKPLTFGDLRKSIAVVAMDVAGRESIWGNTYGPVAQALQTVIPEEESLTPHPPEKEQGGYKLTPRSGIVNFTAAERKFKKTPRIDEPDVPVMTGRDAVAYFVTCNHSGQIKSLFFNYSPNRHFKPYDIVCVHKNKIEPEHFVFSTFGVLQVYPDKVSESLSLAEWQREAVLWKAVSEIPFFKTYLVKKMFDRWRANKLYLDFLRKQKAISSALLPAVPSFGTALLQVMRLLKELITINFLPFETDVMYQLSDFENNVNYKNIKAEKILEKFFTYCKMVATVTAEESFSKLHYCEDQVKKKTYMTKDSLHMQKYKKQQREENLRNARSETGRLGNFVKLCDQMIVEHMFYLTKTQVLTFVKTVLNIGPDVPRDGFYKANLVFTKQDALGISPSKEKFTRALTNTLRGIPTVLCTNAIPIDGSINELPNETQTPPDEMDSVAMKSEQAKSMQDFRQTERRKSTAATSSIKQGSHTQMSEAMSVIGDNMTVVSGAHTERTIPLSKTKSVFGDDGLMKVPELPPETPRTKSEDEIGIATPDLVVKDDGYNLIVEGEGFMGQYIPLSKASLEEKLEKDNEFQEMLTITNNLLSEAMEEIDTYCDFNKWLNEIHLFCKKWTDKSVIEYRGEQAFTIEQKLTELRQWSEKVRNFDQFFQTANGLFFVDCSHIHDNLLPRLKEIYLELVTFVAEEARSLANNFCDEMKIIIENMKNKQQSVDAFAMFAKNYNQYKKSTASFQQKVEYIKSLYEVIRMSSRQLTSDEEKYEENVWAAWEAFLLQMQDASEFVNTQTPLMTQLLEDSYQGSNPTMISNGESEEESVFMELEKEAFDLEEQATSGKFLNPDQNPTVILTDLTKIRDKFYSIQRQLQEASKWREAICGEPYDLSFMTDMTVKLEVRQELWKYVEVSTHAIKEWKAMLFKKVKKMNIKKSLEKIIEWQGVASQLKPYLPMGDKVLTTWFKSLQSFKKFLPILHKLANDALKERHWKAIFVGMNESYEPKRQFTVADLLTYDLEDHAQLIGEIYLGAVAEYDLELKIGHLQKFWLEREFKLAKHIPDSLLQSKALNLKALKEYVKKARAKRAEPKKQTTPRRRTKLEKYRQEKAAAAKDGTPRGLSVEDDDYYVLIEVEDLKYQLEDSRITIMSMMQSPFLGDMTAEVESWCSALQQVEEITDLWFTCQKKWMYLLKVFEWPELYKRFKTQAPKFEDVHAKFKDWMRVVSHDPKVLTVINRRRGEKGYRLLQGDNLRSLFLQLIEMQEEILKHLSSLLDTCRLEFTRLYFLSDEELVEMLGVSRNPQALTSYAKKCFPGINSLAFALPPGTASLNSHLDFALHADKLQVIAFRGQMGEEVPVFAHLEAQPKSTKWLKLLEGIMKNTMATILQGCVHSRMDDGGKHPPIHLLEEIQNYDAMKAKTSDVNAGKQIQHAFKHWLLRFPAQCIYVAEGILWERAMHRQLEKTDLDSNDLKSIMSNGVYKLEQYIEILKEVHRCPITEELRNRLYALLSVLVNQCIEQRDTLDNLVSEKVVSDKSFSWLKTMRYHMDIRTVLRAKQEPVDPQNTTAPCEPPSVARKGKTRRQSVIMRKLEQKEEPSPQLSRMKTSVTTDYQFSRCYIQQLGNSFGYDYEYLGPMDRLVLTPLTERAFLSLTQTIKNFHCGTLIGPPGTGKSETVKDLAKMFGCNLFTINCNQEITLPMMTQYMMGMVQSGSWALFDDTDRLTKGLMSVTAQHLDYLRTVLRTLEASSENQYKIRGQPRYDKKTGDGDAVIRRNSLTTLHPLPNTSSSPQFERQKTVPHGFNEKGLVTYFEETWIAEKEQRRHSIEREIEIQESELYSKNKPPPLFYEHARFKGKKASPDYSLLLREAIYKYEVLGNVMFHGKLIQASSNYGCFMTFNTANPAMTTVPDTFRTLLRPCAMILPDFKPFIETTLLCNGYQDYQLWARKLTLFTNLVKMQLPRKHQYNFGMKDLRLVTHLCASILRELEEAQLHERQEMEDASRQTGSKMDTPPLVSLDSHGLEEQSIVLAIIDVLQPSFETEDDIGAFLNILRDIFPTSTKSKSMSNQYQDTKLVNAVRDQLNEDNMKETPEAMDKILHLYSMIQQKQSVILSGASGSGKSMCLGVLARALNRLNYLLFAPDHSKDELTTNRDLAFQMKTKLSNAGMDEFIPGEEEFLSKLGAPKPVDSKGTKKVRNMANRLTRVQEAIHEMEIKKSPEYALYPKIDLVRLNPTAMTSQELLGHFKEGLWKDGLLQKILGDAHFMNDAVKTYLTNYKKQEQPKQKHKADLPSVLLKWVVMDGILHPNWTESLNTVVDQEKKLSLANGGQVPINISSTQILFESTDLSNTSPSIISHCSIAHFGEETVAWNSLFESWAKTAKSKWIFTSSCMRMILDLVRDVFGPTIKFTTKECCPALLTDIGHTAAMANRVVPGVQEVTSFVMIYSALLDKGYSRDEFEKKIRSRDPDVDNKVTTPSSVGGNNSRMTSSSQIENGIPNYMDKMKNMFAIAYVWAFGGHLHDRFKDKFNKFAHDVLYRATHPIRIPMNGTVFDYTLEEGNGSFIRWNQKSQERPKSLAGGYVVTPEVEKYAYLVDLLISAQQPVLVSGQPGVGKSSLLQNMISSKQASTNITMSPGMTSAIFQETLMAYIIDMKSKALNVITSGQMTSLSSSQKHLFFIDDLNTADNSEGYQPTLELLTQMLSQGGMYDRQRKQFQEMNEAIILASATLPSCPGVGMGQSCHVMSSRLTRLFMNINIFFPNADGILSTFGRNIQHWLEEFPTYSVEHHFEFATALTMGLLELYHKVKEKFKPTPAHPHYIFSLHDISRVVQGILLMSPRTRTRKMMKIKKDKRGSNTTSRQTSLDSRGRASNPSDKDMGVGPSPPMMKVIAQLWCHECTRTFADRLVCDEDMQWYNRILEEIVMKQFCSARDDPKAEMAAISEETFSQSGVHTPQVTPPPPHNTSDLEEDETQDGEQEMVDEEEQDDQQGSSESSKSFNSVSSSRASQISRGSRSTKESMRKRITTSTPDDGESEIQSMPLELGTSDESTHTSTQEPMEGINGGGISETEYETEDESVSDTETESEAETETTETPRDMTSTQVDDSSRGTSRTSESSKSTDSSDVELTDRSTMDRKPSHLSEDYIKGMTPRIRKSVPQRGSLTSSRHVHFKPGLITDREHIAYFGPLLKMDEIKGSQDSLCDFIFSKYYMTTYTETNSLSIEKGYTDTSEEQLTDALQTCLNVYNMGTSQRLEIVFFKEAIRHAARLSRVLAITGGHAVLLGTSYSTGRATLARMAAYIAHCKIGRNKKQRNVRFSDSDYMWERVKDCPGGVGHKLLIISQKTIFKLYEPKRQTDSTKNLRIVREHMKRACYHTGILAKPTVLLVHEDLGMECLQDVAALMAEGTSPGLYTEDELQSIVSHMMPGGVQTKKIDKIEHIIILQQTTLNVFCQNIENLRTSPGLYTEDELQSIVSQMMPGGVQTKKIDKIEQAFDRFLRRVKQHLHVVVCLSFRGNVYSSDFKGLHKVVNKYPNLIKYSCCIDHYQPWSYDAYVTIAKVWLLDERSRVAIPWHPSRKQEQVEMMAKAMSYIHMSVKTAVERQYCHQKEPLRFFSPLTFMEFVHIFRIISVYIVIQETGNIQKHERALGKVNEAFGSITEFKREVSDLSPQHKAATEQIKGLVEEVEGQKADYIQSLDKCKVQEQMIEKLQGPLERLRKDAQSEFDKLNPNYKAAMKALEVLSRTDIDEVKSFRDPPGLVKYVVSALCLLFNKTQDWENGKLLMARENFIQDLIFYDKDDIPEEIYQELCELVKRPDFQPELVKYHSVAAAGICMWVHSIQKYSEIHRNMQPRLKNLLEQEEKFTRAQAKLGQLRVDANRIKSALEQKIQAHKAAVKRAKTIHKSMQNIEKKISLAVNLMENMSMQHFLWKSELRKAKHQIFTAPGDALITAACICYQGPLNDKIRAELNQDWLDRCKQGNFKLNMSVGQDIHNLGYDAFVDTTKEKDSQSETSSSQTDTQSEMGGLSLPEVRTFRYQPVVYDTSKYYKSELKRHGSIEYEPATSFEVEDSDDEDEQSPLMTRNGYSLQAILSDFDELSQWRLEDLPTDLHSIQNALMMRVSCYNRKHCWPLLIDPDNQAEVWVRAIQTSKNIFSEKNVREDDMADTEDLPPAPSSEDKMDDMTHTPHPPSRGTAITFSEYNVEYDGDTTQRTSTTSTTFTTDYTKSGGRHSRQTWESEQLRPVTSVTASWEHCSLHPDHSIIHPEHNLWILEADNPQLDSRLINAIVHGVTVLVTHLERKPINPLFRGLLLKHFYVDKEGYKVVRVSGEDFRFHPNFCLYLSTSVPLFLKGDGLHNIPLHRMCIINMSLSDEAIINYLLNQTMKVERKEFEGQKRSNENDIIRHRQKLAFEHEMIREKTLNLFGPILEDQTMLDSLINCQKEVERNRMILEETRYMGDHLEEKFSHYVPMIMQAAMLYNMIQRMAVLHSYYYMPFYKFVDMFTNVIRSRDRGKGAAGAPASRAKELMDAIYTNVFKYVSMMMFEQHFLLLQLLVTLEKLRLSRKASAKELGIFLNGFDKQGLDDASLLEKKPDWMSGQEWIDCLVLEQLHHSFHGLRKSLVQFPEQWREYFQHPISLMNTVPGVTLQELSIFQKCILWKMAQPDKLSEVADALILSELGNIRTIPDHYNIREVYNFATKTTPVVFILPNDLMDTKAADGTKGLPYVSPTHEVKRLAKEVGMEGKVKIMNFGVDGHMSEIRQAVEDCIQTGYWLLLQNYHLAEEPEQEFFQLLKDIVYTTWDQAETVREKSSIQEDKTSLVTYAKKSTDKKFTTIANSFRLWITTQSDMGRLIPGVLVQHGIKVTAESTGNFKSTLQKSYRSVAFLLNNFELPTDEGTVAEKVSRIMPLALLHSLLLQQCYYGNGVFMSENHWSLTDLAMAVDMYKKVMLKCDCKEKVADLVAQVYTDHCTDMTDHKVVKALVQTLAKYAALPQEELQEATDSTIVRLLKNLLYYEDGHFNLKRAVDSLEELSARTFGLPDIADSQQTVNVSSVLGKDMVQVVGAPELFLKVTSGTSNAVLSKEVAIPQYITMLQNFPLIPETNKNQVYPIDVFLHYEAEGYRTLLDRINGDLNLLQRKSRGEILPSAEMNNIIHSINRNIVPKAWTSQTFQSAMKVSDWLAELYGRIGMLREYILGDKPATYNLSAFLRPDRFLESVKQTYARRQFKDIDFIEFNVEVMPAGLRPSIPPPEGVFITGLRLHNSLWDGTRSALMMPAPDSPDTQDMPVFWVKPQDMSSPQLTRRTYPLYKCPVYCSSDIRQHGQPNVVVHFTLPSECDPTVWEYQRAFLSTSLN